MAKVVYNSKLAKVLLYFSNYHTITLLWWVFTELSEGELTETVKRHKGVHVAQFEHLACVGCIVYIICIVAWWLPLVWALPLLLLFYVWYMVEWLVRVIVYACRGYENICYLAYADLSFECEARAWQDKEDIDVGVFDFLRYY